MTKTMISIKDYLKGQNELCHTQIYPEAINLLMKAEFFLQEDNTLSIEFLQEIEDVIFQLLNLKGFLSLNEQMQLRNLWRYIETAVKQQNVVLSELQIKHIKTVDFMILGLNYDYKDISSFFLKQFMNLKSILIFLILR